MARKENDMQYSGFTVPQELAAALEQFLKENGMSRNSAINLALEHLIFEEAKKSLPDRAGDVDDFMMKLKEIMKLYEKALDLEQSAEKRAEEKVRVQLDAMAGLAAENSKLKAQLADAMAKIDELEQTYGGTEKIKADMRELERLRREEAEWLYEKAAITAKHAEEMSKMQTECFERVVKMLAATKSQAEEWSS